MPDLAELIKSLSPGALQIYKRQLASLPEKERQATFSRLSGIPELSDIIGQPTPITKKVPTQKPITEPSLGQKVLSTATAPFRWIEQNITQPFGAIVTSPFTSATTGTQGMNWLQRERAEYKAWDDPNWGFLGVKGAVETLPWLAIPTAGGVAARLGGIAAKGGAIGRGAALAGKVVKPIAAVEAVPGKIVGKVIKGVTSKIPIVEEVMSKVGQWTLPSKELLNQAYKETNINKLAQWAETKPVIGNVVKSLGGERIFVKAESQLPEDIVQREIINRVRLQEIGVNMQGANMPRLTKFGDPIKLLGITEGGVVNTAISKVGKASRYLNDILENPAAYKFTTKEAGQYIQEFSLMRKDLAKLLEVDGLKQSPKVHRIVKGIVTEDGKYIESKFGSDPSLSRIYETQEESALAHLQKGQKIVYGVNPNEIMRYEFDRTINRIARNRFALEVGKLGQKPIEKFAEIYPEKASQIASLGVRRTAAQNALDVIQKVLSYKATSIPGATLAKISRELPDMAGKIRILFELKPANAETVLGRMSRELRLVLKTDPAELKKAVRVISNVETTWRGTNKINMMDIETAIKNLNMHAEVEAKLITSGYKETIKANKQFFKDFMVANRDYLETVIKESNSVAAPLKKDRYKFLQGYAGREKLPHKAGEVTERPFNRIPEFRGKFFDDKIVTYLEKFYLDEGNKWTRIMGSISAMSRNMTAVLDDSAPFIQGLFTLGRRPDIWAKSTIRQLNFLVQPENFTKYMAKPENLALHAEMVKYGSMVQTFELFEALPQVKRLTSKIPVVGKVAQKGIEQTYGRAEAAFTGFGQLARDNMWKALRKSNMTDVELQELARTLDLMTGNLSTRAMGIGATQRELESAFGFFSPRFTRASLAFIGDIFKGGISGAEARKSIAGLMAGGSAMYLGICKATGQEPDFNPSSGRFMTIKVGDIHVGIGGMIYSLARLGGNLATVDSPTDLLKLDRFDNPFIKFLYGKTAPLTGLGVGVIEQKNYMGQPFESIGDWAKFLAGKVLPFGVQPLLEEKNPTPVSFGAQLVGLREFPKSSYELRDEARQAESKKLHKADFASLTKLEQNKIDKLPAVQKLTESMKKEGRETPESMLWDNWNQEGEVAETTYRKVVTLASKEFKQTGNGVTFRAKIDEANSNRRAIYAQRAQNPQYTTIQAYFNTPRTPDALSKMHPLDVAREEYYRLMYSPKMFDQFENYNFDLADQKESAFIIKYGQKAKDYIEEFQGARWPDKPAELKLLEQVREILKPYWQIEDKIWSMYPSGTKEFSDQIKLIGRTDQAQEKRLLFRNPTILRARELIALEKSRMRKANPAIKQAYQTFYGY